MKWCLYDWRITPPVITCIRGFLRAHGSEQATAAGEPRGPRARGMAAHADAAPRARVALW